MISAKAGLRKQKRITHRISLKDLTPYAPTSWTLDDFQELIPAATGMEETGQLDEFLKSLYRSPSFH